MTALDLTDLNFALNLFTREPSLLNAIKVMDVCRGAVIDMGYKTSTYQSLMSLQDDGYSLRFTLRVEDEEHNDAHSITKGADSRDGNARIYAALQEIVSFVKELPSITDWKRAKWREELVALKDKGEALNIGFEYTEMLKATAAKLATNALAAPSVHSGGIVLRGLHEV